MKKKKGIAILGSTGSIGTQALEVINGQSDHFAVELLSAHSNADLLIHQAKKYKPNMVVITQEHLYDYVKDALWNEDIKVYAGIDALCQAVQTSTIDIVLTALVGYAGLRPTIAAIEGEKNIALANKETLVVAGEIITRLAQEKGVNIYPVDSEHSAIFQCLVGEFHNPIEKIYLTASGGPFRGKSKDELRQVTKQEALQHPNWSMGQKITIDSATLMNKGLEVIEAKWLFGLQPHQIDVIIHPQSIIHSIVEFADGSMKAQMGLPDMKIPIQYALSYPVRLPSSFPRFNFMNYPELTFEQPDKETFKNLQLAYDVMKQGGNKPCVLNAANEVAVQLFLEDKISFLEIAELNEHIVNNVPFIAHPTIEDYIQSDQQARKEALNII